MVSSIQHRRSLLEPASLCNGTYTSASNSLVLSAHKALLWTLCLQCFHHMFSLQKKKHSLTTVDRTSVAKCTGKAWITFCCHGSGKWLKQHHRHWRQERPLNQHWDIQAQSPDTTWHEVAVSSVHNLRPSCNVLLASATRRKFNPSHLKMAQSHDVKRMLKKNSDYQTTMLHFPVLEREKIKCL